MMLFQFTESELPNSKKDFGDVITLELNSGEVMR